MAMKSMMNADMCEKEPSSSLAFSSSSSHDLWHFPFWKQTQGIVLSNYFWTSPHECSESSQASRLSQEVLHTQVISTHHTGSVKAQVLTDVIPTIWFSTLLHLICNALWLKEAWDISPSLSYCINSLPFWGVWKQGNEENRRNWIWRQIKAPKPYILISFKKKSYGVMTFDTYFSVTSKWPQKCDIEREI